MSIKIRKLKVKDLDFIIGLLQKFIVDSNQKWISTMVKTSSTAAPSEEKEDSEESTGGEMITFFVDLFQDLLMKYQSDTRVWFADLIGVQPEDYTELDFDTDMIVMQQIKEASEFASFFEKACAVFKLKKLFGNIVPDLKKKFGSLTA